ncbi:MerR family transcriptional regulator [Paraglaciecola marina]|uniref:MerR family transcriptional regulator n=1 Tax=Paraglaciecola marina TaxID=2500157 RepID=UPI00105E372D|nr:MerR family DNA-binding transcriptional regulator [Paraglaciecola marina]
MKEQNFSIGELSKAMDITPRTIRFYEEQGLLNPSRVGQKRIYSNKDWVRLKLILRGKRLGFSLSETRTLFDLYDTHQNSQAQLQAMLKMTAEKKVQMQLQLQDIEILMTELHEVEARCQSELNALTQATAS